MYSQETISSIIIAIFSKVRIEFEKAETQSDIDSLCVRYGVEVDNYNYFIDPKRHKIIIVGDLSGKKYHYVKAAKEYGINENQLEFLSDYSKLSNYNTERLRNSDKYSDIFYGPAPHKMKGINGESSLIAVIKNNQNEYPKLHEMKCGNDLKITISNFREAILKSRLYKSQ